MYAAERGFRPSKCVRFESGAKAQAQVFVSSTFGDLRSERQAAVEAILKAGHIPAGMELFIAGDESQLETIKRWIDESDIYMLILGSRYGSIEPKSGLSYTEVEYYYAVDSGMPFSPLSSKKKCWPGNLTRIRDFRSMRRVQLGQSRGMHSRSYGFREIVQDVPPHWAKNRIGQSVFWLDAQMRP